MSFDNGGRGCVNAASGVQKICCAVRLSGYVRSEGVYWDAVGLAAGVGGKMRSLALL